MKNSVLSKDEINLCSFLCRLSTTELVGVKDTKILRHLLISRASVLDLVSFIGIFIQS